MQVAWAQGAAALAQAAVVSMLRSPEWAKQKNLLQYRESIAIDMCFPSAVLPLAESKQGNLTNKLLSV